MSNEISYMIERTEPDPRFPIALSFFGNAEDFEKIGGARLWKLRRFIRFPPDIPPFFGAPVECNKHADLLFIKWRIAHYEIERLDRKLEDLRR